MRQHSSALEQKWNRQLTRPIFAAGAKNAVWNKISADTALVQEYQVTFPRPGSHSAKKLFSRKKNSKTF